MSIQESLEELKAYKLSNWVLFVIGDNIHNPVLGEFAQVCIDKNVLYVCAAGRAGTGMDDLFDMEMVLREIEGRQMPAWYRSKDDILMTSWHHDLDEGFWFCTSLTSYEDHPIDTVLVVNLTAADYLPRIEDLALRIVNGWQPAD